MKKILAISLLSSLIAVPALAGAPGAYVAADVQSWSATNADPFGNPGAGLRIAGGYRFTPNIGVELGLAQSGATKEATPGGPGTPPMTFKVSATQLAAVGTYPVNAQFDLFAKLGMSANKVTPSAGTCDTCSKTSVMFGIGGQFNLSQNLGIRLLYENLGNATDSGTNDVAVSTLSLGVVYSF